VTEGKSEATRKKYKAMIEQIVSLSGENTLQLAKPTATHRTFATTIKNDRFEELFESRECNLQSYPRYCIDIGKSKWKTFCDTINQKVIELSENNGVGQASRKVDRL
jgi:hypothetical protein